jgi:hypothetical protein
MRLHRRSAFYGATISMISLISCASVTYKYYGLTVPDTCYAEGSLLGKLGASGWQDLPFSECEPDASLKGKCVVELASDHFAKETALEQCQSDLKNCQAP